MTLNKEEQATIGFLIEAANRLGLFDPGVSKTPRMSIKDFPSKKRVSMGKTSQYLQAKIIRELKLTTNINP